MSTAKRRLNYTGRKRIKRENIDIRMVENAGSGPLRAKAELNLEGLGFPADARVVIEAYHRSSGMRFDCGTVGDLQIPPVLTMDEVDHSGSVLFRVKVIDEESDTGKILGSAERVQPRSDESEDGRKSIFPVLFREIGEQTWYVDFADPSAPPTLILNRRIPGISQALQDNPLLQGFLLPAALRFVLERLVRQEDAGEDDEDESGWKAEWLEFCSDTLGLPGDPMTKDREGREEWVDNAITAFCEDMGFLKNIKRHIGE
ncbi:hypothetical protein [Oricola indica]|jgi:hypothetical protein|uniref:hypothetical protein n=1 Tax=Oricola indica TaxID=2872591 RepID=UPI001CBAF4D0|nr:hypothetical protein [Oricola indica]